MRILHITRDFPPPGAGGISTAVGGMARAQAELGHAVAAISADGWRPRASARSRPAPRGPSKLSAPNRPGEPIELGPDGVRVLRVTGADPRADAVAFAETFRPSVVHVHHGTLWPLAAAIRAHRRVPTVFCAHVLQRAQNRLRGIERPTHSLRAQDLALAEADLIHAPSAAAAALLKADYPGRRVRVARLGVHDRDAARRAAANPDARADGPVTFVGRFDAINGIGEVLAAIPQIAVRFPDTRFAVVGGLPHNPKGAARWRRRFERDALARDHDDRDALARDLDRDRNLGPGLADRVAFPGWLDADALADVYARARLVISASWIESFGLVALEAMLFGAPIVAPDLPAIRALITDGVTGALSPPQNASALVERAAALLANPARAAAMGAAAAAAARAEHLWPDRIGAICDLYADAARR